MQWEVNVFISKFFIYIGTIIYFFMKYSSVSIQRSTGKDFVTYPPQNSAETGGNFEELLSYL